MSHENNIVKYSYLHSTGYLYSEDPVLRHWTPIKVSITCKSKRKYGHIVSFFPETIRRKVVYHFGAEL